MSTLTAIFARKRAYPLIAPSGVPSGEEQTLNRCVAITTKSMKTSAALMKSAGIYPKLKLGVKKEGANGKKSVHATGPHTVRLISDKITKGRDRDSGTIIELVKYVVEEGGVKRQYSCPLKNKETGELHYLVQILSKVPENTEVIMEMKKMGPRNYVEVRNLDGTRIDSDEDTTAQYETDEDMPEEDLEAAFDGVEKGLGEMPDRP